MATRHQSGDSNQFDGVGENDEQDNKQYIYCSFMIKVTIKVRIHNIITKMKMMDSIRF